MKELPVIHIIAAAGTSRPFDNAGMATIDFKIADIHYSIGSRGS